MFSYLHYIPDSLNNYSYHNIPYKEWTGWVRDLEYVMTDDVNVLFVEHMIWQRVKGGSSS